jgi:hypothetical protein
MVTPTNQKQITDLGVISIHYYIEVFWSVFRLFSAAPRTQCHILDSH